jgi:hypothetical protein
MIRLYLRWLHTDNLEFAYFKILSFESDFFFFASVLLIFALFE